MNHPVHPDAEENQDDLGFRWFPLCFCYLFVYFAMLSYVFLHPGGPVNTAQELANTVWGFAKMGRSDAPLLAVLARAASRCASEFKIQELANSVWAFATV